MAAKAPKPTKQQVEQARLRAKGGIPMDAKAKDLRGMNKAMLTVATMLPGGRAGKAIGVVAGKAINRVVAKEASPAILKAANAAKGSGKMVNPKPAMGKIERTAPKRNVIVKTQDKTIATNGFISKNGHQVVKVNTKNPIVRTVEKEVTAAKAASQTKSTNKLRYGSAKAESKRGRDAVEGTKAIPKALGRAGAAAGATAGPLATNAKKNKSK